uniref:ubiquitinyl hydrolase 1 n=1 Tax=Ditylum brightwellii TaxID=49249 RepID=A0A6V2M4H7_9STRA
MKYPGSVREEMTECVRKHAYVSAACRLSAEEELLLLKLCSPSARGRLSAGLINRQAFVSAMGNVNNIPEGKALTVKLVSQQIPHFEDFDQKDLDTTIIDNPKNSMISSKLFGSSYSRPEEEQVAYGGVKALEFINAALSHGISITSGHYGFALMYDMLVGTVAFKLHPNDRTHNWGRMLFRLLPSSEFKSKSSEMSVLRILAETPVIASHPHVPKLHLESGVGRLKGLVSGKDPVSSLLKELNAFLTKSSVSGMLPKSAVPFKEYTPPRTSVQIRRPKSYSEQRLWVVPRITDYSQDLFRLDIENCASVNIPPSQLQAFASKPLAPIKLGSYVQYLSRHQRRLPIVSDVVPFDFSNERACQTHSSQTTIQRITSDVKKFANKTNAETIPTLIGFSPSDIDSFHQSSASLEKAQGQLNALIKSLNKAMNFDRKSLGNLMKRALAIATSDEKDSASFDGDENRECNFLKFRLGQYGDKEPTAWLELLVASILSSTAEHDIRSLNPYLSSDAYKTVTSLTAVSMLTSIRIGQSHRALTSLSKLILLLRKVDSSNAPDVQTRLCQEISLQASMTASDLTSERHFMKMSASEIVFDPRYLVFEFTYSLMLRKSQVILVDKFMSALREGRSMCHQMIMGAGKTTVVAPLLALMLADGKSLVTQVVPHALLEMSRSVMREKFAAVVRKPVFTFNFDRGTRVTRDLYMKLCKARDSKAIMCATPTSVKSFMLKFIEMMRHLEHSKTGNKKKGGFFQGFNLSSLARRFRDRSVVTELHVNPEDVYYCTEILKLFRTGVLLLDEVDLILHPLKSELNWPIGQKEPIDYSRSERLGIGIRWQIQWHLIDAIFYATEKKMSVNFGDSREALVILEGISDVINRGIASQQVQHTPHLILLNRKYYIKELKHLMARWQLIYLRSKRLPTVEDRHLLSYMVNGPTKDQHAASAVSVALDDEFMKMLNLSHDLINNFAPHALSKINRVGFGLLSRSDLKQAMEVDPHISLTRQLAAIPFVGKDVPSRASQFSHPDVVISLTILAYRYEGLRLSDFVTLISELRETLDSEYGPFHKRPSAKRYVMWVEEAGGKVRGPKKTDDENMDEDEVQMSQEKFSGKPSDEIWPLHLLDVKDDHHMSITYKLLHRLPHAIEYYLDSFVFPLIMEHHGEKISCSGQDLGGEMLFGRRVGFSGTPSDLLPEELGQCHYEECVDGQVLHYLTTESIVTSRVLGVDWTVTGLLDDLIATEPPFGVLIDTGALITGMSNYEVAKYLLTHGLSDRFDGVVFLDHKDRKMILMRHGMNVVRLNQAGIPTHRRFSFYDQIHTTGMDIHQAIDARAAQTLGKDMTFRDYSQGAFRMRGIGKGQTIELFIIPEVMELVKNQKNRLNPQLMAPQQPTLQPTHNPLGDDLLDLAAIPTQQNLGGAQLLVDVASWLTVNGMKSENMQFRMLCQQSIFNVTRKRSFNTLNDCYRELTQYAFSGRVKEIAAIAAAAANNSTGDITADLDKFFDGTRKLFAEDIVEIRNVLQPDKTAKNRRVGIERLQKCLDLLNERIDYTVQNSIPLPIPLSETLNNNIERNKDFITNDYDKAVVDKILMVLTTSESMAKRQKLVPVAPADSDETGQDLELQREQVAEEEVLQEEEEEEEEEEEVVKESAKKKKYSRDGENPTPWFVASLAKRKKSELKGKHTEQQQHGKKLPHDVGTWENNFYSARDFSVKNYTYTKPVSLEFPEYMYLSNNYFEKGWGFKTHRRLKNVIVVMDFVPSKSAIREIADVGKAFTSAQEKTLKNAFSLSATGNAGDISPDQLEEVLKAVDVDVDGEEGQMFLATMRREGKLTFDRLKQMLTQRRYYRVQAGRYYVALSLVEAECMRAALHSQYGLPLVPNRDTTVALRTGQTLIDASMDYEPAQTYQDSTAKCCYRFLDCEVNYSKNDLSFLLRALQKNDCERRSNFFIEVRSNRRRKQVDPSTTALSKVFVTADEHHMLQFRIATGRITAVLKNRGLYARDAFAAFDHDHDGLINLPELRRGLEWLGLKLDPTLLRQFMKEIDKDNDGYINLEEFKKAVGWDEGSENIGALAVAPPVMPLPPIPREGDKKQVVKIPEAVLAGIKIKLKKVTKFSQVWKSQGSMSRYKGSVWAPVIHSGAFKQNRAVVYLGYYAGHGFDNPNRDSKERVTMEITDTTANWVGGSTWLPHVLDRFMPRPARFRLIWSITSGSNPFYAWEPVPPSDNFVAMGHIGTTTDKEPDVKLMRCICKHWVKESTLVKSIWDDSGSGGREASIWIFNPMHLIGFVPGHDPPRQKTFELKSQRFFLREFSDIKTDGVVPASSRNRR